MGQRVLIYLADLTHTGLQVATESFPLNVGLVASNVKKHLGDRVEIRLFKYPEKLTAALRREMPDILGCSNYVWNSNLSEWALGYAKRRHPNVVTVQGGTNYPFGAAGQLEFLQLHPNTDFHIFYEGETAFLNLVSRFIEIRNLQDMKGPPIAGCQFISREGSLVAGEDVPRIKRLDDIPSPYVTGLMDEFFDGRLTPMMETTRGCPFSCNFCNAGDQYFTKVNMFSLDYVKEELNYIAPRISAAGVSNLTLADNNFGMYPRDADICLAIRDVQEEYGWPMGLISTTGKNNKERILKATEILGGSLLVSMSVQSMDTSVLKLIKRDNIRLDAYKQINAELVSQGRSGMAELIWALPGETYESFMRGVESVIEAGANKVTSYTLQLLYGTDYKDSEYRRQHGYQGKWRLVPLDFGEYDGERIFDVEEVAVASKHASFDDYLLVRGFALVTEASYNNYIFWELLRYLQVHGIAPYAWMREIWERRDDFPAPIRAIFESFEVETKGELFDTEEELKAFYTANYERVIRGEIGGNVLFKHKARLMTGPIGIWIEHIARVAAGLVVARAEGAVDAARVSLEIDELQTYLTNKLSGMLNPSTSTEPVRVRLEHDITAWLRDDQGRPLSDFLCPDGVEYVFYFTDQQVAEMRDSFRRYGTDVHGLAKILARIPSNERLFRQVKEASVSDLQVAHPSKVSLG